MSNEQDVIRLRAKVSALEAEAAKHRQEAEAQRHEVRAESYRAKAAEDRIAEMAKEAERAAKLLQQERMALDHARQSLATKDGVIAMLQEAVLSWESECLELRARGGGEPPQKLHANHPIAEALADFREEIEDHQNLARATVLHYEYDQEQYEGHALCVYELDGKLYEVEGSHCSCNGLEEQWDPTETTAETLLMRPRLPSELRAKLTGSGPQPP